MEWYPCGTKKEEVFYLNDLFHGKLSVWYDNDRKAYRSWWSNGSLHGTYSRWYRSGQIQFAGRYEEDHIFSDIGWKPNGERSETKVREGSGLMVDYYEIGQKEAERVFRNGKLVCSRGWDLEGEPNESMVEDGEGYDLVTYPDGSRVMEVYELGEVVDLIPVDS